jgi:hypothetical protein
VKDGRNDFPIEIGPVDVAEITSIAHNMSARSVELSRFIQMGAPFSDIKTASVLMALHEFLTTRRCQPDFEVNLNVD